MDTTPLVLGIDMSTTACKAILWTLQGEAVSEGRAPLSLLRPRPLWHEQPAQCWWTALVEAVRQAVDRRTSAAQEVVALCVTAQRETFVPVDAGGRPLRPAIFWMDERGREFLPQIARDYGAERFHRETGKPLSVNLAPGKLLWLREHEPEVFQRAHKFLDVAAFLNYHLTGVYRTGWGCVDPMGLFDMPQQTWASELLSYLDIRPAQMPEAFPPGAVLGQLTDAAAAYCGLRPGIPVVAGVGDGQSGGLGVHTTDVGQAYLNLGTAVVTGTYTRHYRVDPAFRTMFSGIVGGYVLETVLLGGTYTLDWFIEQLLGVAPAAKAQALAEYDAALDTIPPGAEGLMVVPYWNSVLNPYWDPEASGVVVGWRGIHTQAHLYRALLEGIAFELRLHGEGVAAALGRSLSRYVAMGGGAHNARWCQILADVTGLPVYQAQTAEAAALGAGMLAAVGAGLFEDPQTAAVAMSRIADEPCRPDVVRAAWYTQLYEGVYRHLYPALRDYLGRLSRLTASGTDPRQKLER